MMRRARVLMVLVLLGSLAGVGGVSAQQTSGSQEAALTGSGLRRHRTVVCAHQPWW